MSNDRCIGARCLLACAILAAALDLSANPAAAQDFFQGKQIRIVVGSAPGGGYDAYARVLSRHWAKHIPGEPKIIVQHMPGAGGLVSMNHVANVAAKDGLTVGAVQNVVVYEPLMGGQRGKSNAQFDPIKVNWIGSMTKEVFIPFLFNPPPVKSVQELIDTRKEVVMGTTSPTNMSAITGRLMNSLLGTNFKIVAGYANQAPIWLALERGELQGNATFYSTIVNGKADWIRDNKITLLAQMSLEKHPDLPNVPLVLDFVTSTEGRQLVELMAGALSMGRPYVLPEGVPADRVKILTDAFMAAMKDPDLIQEARKQGLEILPIDGDAIRQILVKMYATPRPIVDKAAAYFTGKE